MTLLDILKLDLIRSDARAQALAEGLVECWHRGLVPGELQQILGLSPREYQAWTTGGVSLLTIANWHRKGMPQLDQRKPWFKLGGRPGKEQVGYLEDMKSKASRRSPAVSGRRR